MIDAAAIRPRRDHARREQSFDFGREKQPVALLGPKKRRDTKTITSEVELTSWFVPQCDGKLPSQAFPHFLPIIFPQMGNDFGVTMCDEFMAALFQFGLPLDVIK